jgi:hypothetical protein
MGLCGTTDASGADCGSDFICLPGEVCRPSVLTFGPDYSSVVDYACQSNTNLDGSLGTGTLMDGCDPGLLDGNGTGIHQCAGGICFDDVSEGSGYCSGLCDPNNDTCSQGGTPDMKCLLVESVTRKGIYADNSGGYYACRKNVDCTPCYGSGFCPADRVCADVGFGFGAQPDYRCVLACDNNADCANAPATQCTQVTDGYGAQAKGCFNPVNPSQACPL